MSMIRLRHRRVFNWMWWHRTSSSSNAACNKEQLERETTRSFEASSGSTCGFSAAAAAAAASKSWGAAAPLPPPPPTYQDLTVALKGPVIHPRSRNYYYLERQVLSSFFQAWLGAMDAISGVLSRELEELQQVVARLLPCIVPLDYYLEDVDQHQSLAWGEPPSFNDYSCYNCYGSIPKCIF